MATTPTTRGTDRVALVAGASRGIGADTARAFARAGHAVVLGARDTDALARVVDDIEAARRPRRRRQDRRRRRRLDARPSSSSPSRPTAGSTPRSTTPPTARCRARWPTSTPTSSISGIRTNVRGTFLGMKFQIPAMLASGGGAIVNMASVAGVRAMTNLARLRRREGRDHRPHRGRRPRLRRPGRPRQRRRARPDPHPPPRARPARRHSAWPPRRSRWAGSARPPEVADVVLWLCSEQSSFVTGVDHADRRRPARRAQAAADVPPRRRNGPT